MSNDLVCASPGGEPSTSGADGARAAGGSLGVDASDGSAVCGSLLKGLVFFLAREVPREPLLFVIRCVCLCVRHLAAC